ncbi:MAG: DUF6603 domain-containing protein [Eisenbergiella sp.]
MRELPDGRPSNGGSSPLTNHIRLEADASIGKLHFLVSYTAGKECKELAGAWIRKSGEDCGLALLSEELAGTPLPFRYRKSSRVWPFLKELRFAYAFEAEEFSLRLATTEYGALSIRTGKAGGLREFVFTLELGMKLSLSAMPLLGDCIGDEWTVELDWLSLKLGGSQRAALSACLAVAFGNTRLPLTLGEENGGVEETRVGTGVTEHGEQTEAGDIKWVDIKKNLGPVRLSRLGFVLGEGSITVYVDAGLSLSVLLFEVLGLYVTVPMKKGKAAAFGMQGLTVSIRKDPLILSGGLYITREQGVELYTGELSVRVKNFQLMVLGSYGKLPGGEASFCLADAVLPPGRASGFRYNGDSRRLWL